MEQANADAELQRALGLRAQDFVSPQAVDAARRRADAARAGVASAQAGIAAARGSIAPRPAQVQVQAVNQANTEIRAPFDGVVLVKNANVGDMITPFSSAAGAQGAVVTMADMGTLEVEADVSESNVGRSPSTCRWRSRSTPCPRRAFAAAWCASCPRWTAPRPR